MIVLIVMVMKGVPAGYMPDLSSGKFVLAICSGAGPVKMVMPMGASPRSSGEHDQGGKDESPCGFGGDAPPAMIGIDLVLLVGAIAFILRAGLIAAAIPVLTQRKYLRPPLRGPPVTA